MSFRPSSAEEIQEVNAFTRKVHEFIQELMDQGKKVHIIWDVDHVLVSGRSDEIFTLLGFNVAKYFQYEERLITEMLEPGPWANLAKQTCTWGITQDIVTARSSFLALRVTYFLLSQRLRMRWQLFVGHQSKAESYRIILSSFAKEPNTIIISIDDAVKHVDAFHKIVTELHMQDRCIGVLAPKLHRYSEAELKKEIDLVLSPDATEPFRAEVRLDPPGENNRIIMVTPNAQEVLQRMFFYSSLEMYKQSVVAQHRLELEQLADELLPGKEKTNERLFALYELVREP